MARDLHRHIASYRQLDRLMLSGLGHCQGVALIEVRASGSAPAPVVSLLHRFILSLFARTS